MEPKSVDIRGIYHELGATLSYDIRLGNSMEIGPYSRAVVRKGFIDGNRVKMNNGGNFVNDLSGRRGIYQAGIKASFSSMLGGYFGVGYSHGAGVESPWNAMAGVNWPFWPSTVKLRFGVVFAYRMLKEEILGQKKPASYGGKPRPMGGQ